MKMTRTALLLAMTFLWTGGAVAQISCRATPDAITHFRDPEFSLPVVWRGVVGGKGVDQLVDGALMDDGSVVLGGSYTVKKDDPLYHPLLVRMAPRGKILWQMRGTNKVEQTIDRVARDEGGIVTLGGLAAHDKSPKKMVVTRYDAQGKHLGAFIIGEGDGNLIPANILALKDGYLVAARYENLRIATQRFGVVYKTDRDGRRLWRRAYIPGLDAGIEAMIALKNGDLLLGGEVREQGDHMIGWLLRLGADGGLKWQQSYPRGRNAQITDLAEAADGSGYIAGGTSWPLGSDGPAGWIMKVDTGGTTLWDRYYKGPDQYRITDVMALGDGRTAAILSSIPVAASDEDVAHVRYVLVSPRGELLDADSITDGAGLNAARMLDAGGAPLLIGTMDNPIVDEKAKGPPPSAFDGWVGQLQPPASYDDPCLKQ